MSSLLASEALDGQTTGPGWPRASLLALALGAAALALLFLPEARAAIEIWDASTAYGHCYLVLPMAVYLLWDRRALLRRSQPAAELRWLACAAPIVAGWFVADRLGIMEGRQLAAVAAFQLLFLVVLGWRLYWQLSGPLLFLFFTVPFGAFVTPALQHFTAAFTVVWLNLLGIPNYVDNFIIETPAGTFLVAEACAGLRFLIAAVAFGVFYALLSFRSPVRRAAYIALAIAVPIVANGFRAFGIVYLGQLLGSAEAAAADHIIYGWIFFSVVMLLLVAVGQPFREATVVAADIPPRPARARRQLPVTAACAVVLCTALGPGAAVALDASARARPLSGALDWIAPPGCSVSAGVEAATIRTARILCGPRGYALAVKTYPARSTARAVVADRRRATGELGAEDSSASPMEGLEPGAGRWTVVQTAEPDAAIAFAEWAGGAPALGGIAGRLMQARSSILGSTFQPVLVTLSAEQPGRIGSAERRAAVQELERIVAAQTGLSARMAQLSAVGGG